MNKYKIVAIMGKAGAGKDTLLRECLALDSNRLHEIISCTTRPPREGEVEGVNYYYLTEKEFMDRLADDRMLEATEFRKWYYGTSIEALNQEKTNIGVFNPAGVRILMSLSNVAVLPIYVIADDKTRILR
jgi:guanylate kinase